MPVGTQNPDPRIVLHQGDITTLEVAERTGRNLGVLLLARLVERLQLWQMPDEGGEWIQLTT